MKIEDKIICYAGRYDKTAFYAKMGHFFAEEKYRRQMPYLRNEPDRVWFTIEENDRVIAFSSLRILDEYVLFTTEYTEFGYRRRGFFKLLTDVRFDYCKDMDMPVRTSTDLDYIRDYYIKQGFDIYRDTKNYWFLIKDNSKGVMTHELARCGEQC